MDVKCTGEDQGRVNSNEQERNSGFSVMCIGELSKFFSFQSALFGFVVAKKLSRRIRRPLK